MKRFKIDLDAFERVGEITVRVELVLVGIIDGSLKVLMASRPDAGGNDRYFLPGRSLSRDKSLQETAASLCCLMGLEGVVLDEVGGASAPDRSLQNRSLSMIYFAPVDEQRLLEVEAAGVGFKLLEINFAGEKEFYLADDGARARVGSDHRWITIKALHHLDKMIAYSTMAFRFVPEKFTLLDLEDVYEILTNERVSKPVFRKRMLARRFEDGRRLIALDEIRNGRGRPARLYMMALPKGRRAPPSKYHKEPPKDLPPSKLNAKS